MKLNIENVNELIEFWRKHLAENYAPSDKLIARCYIDAYQTIRVNHGLTKLG